MKHFIALAVMVGILAATTSAMAVAHGENSFALYSAASGAVKTSTAFDVRKFKTKSLQVTGATLASNSSTQTFKNMSGTVLAECSQNGSLWVTCIGNEYAQTAVSRTTSGIFTWTDAINYVRLKWTAGTVGTKLKAWFSWSE